VPEVKVFHSGTALVDGQVVTAGGRVLAVTALGNTIAAAKLQAYTAVKCIRWQGAWPNVIFLDLNMPVVDGFSFLNLFSSLPEKVREQSRIVVLTSSNSVTDREQVFLYRNVIHMITKPMKQADIEALRILVAD
jgi:CheY-like chemotaxis protein